MKPFVLLTTGVLLTALFSSPAQASGPIAVYALVDSVAFEPEADKPERIRLTGVFITAEERTDNYSQPQRGYLYLSLPTRGEATALKEWSDLKSVAGSRQVVGFGSSWSSKLRVRKAAEDAKSPDVYPMGNGLFKVNPDQPRAQALLDYKDR